ncbi:MAG: hypothetical protein AB7V56_08070 [Candidatus Nitrosocosmicus sp.]
MTKLRMMVIDALINVEKVKRIIPLDSWTDTSEFSDCQSNCDYYQNCRSFRSNDG